MSATTPHAAEFFSLFQSAVIWPRKLNLVDNIITRIMLHRDKYEAVEKLAGTPWFVVALLHSLECDLNFGLHLHNGDNLYLPTVNDPAHRPPGWGDLPDAERTWEKSALDALQYDRVNVAEGWDVPQICAVCERYNGLGYRNRNVPNPYLWAGCQHYVKGKFIRDHVFDPEAVSDQIGLAVILKRMDERKLIALEAIAA